MIEVPEPFANQTVAREGEPGRAWIDRLPRLVDELCSRWGLRVDGPPMHGALGLVLPVRHRGAPYVLKVSWIDEETAEEAAALAAWDGNGAVRMYAHDPNRGALLLERLDATRTLDDVPIEMALDTAADLLCGLAIEHADGVRMRVRDWAARLSTSLPARQRELGDPMPSKVLGAALAYADALGPSAGSALLSRDLHYQNVLAGTREPWLLIDPKPIVGDLEFALAPLVWRRTGEPAGEVNLRTVDGRLRRLEERADLDPERARAWTLVRCVEYGLWAHGSGLTWDAAICRELACWLARA